MRYWAWLVSGSLMKSLVVNKNEGIETPMVGVKEVTLGIMA